MDKATHGITEAVDPVHIAATILDGCLNDNDELFDLMVRAHPVAERARGMVILAGLLAHTVAKKQDIPVTDVLADLVASAP